MKMIEISICIVNYNVKFYLEQALQSIKKALVNINSEIFVIDNASSDGSVEMIRKHFPDVKLIQNKENVGFARANNQAIQKARGQTICLINPDTLVREDTFNVCLDYLKKHPAVGVVGCKILNPDGSLQLACRRSFPTPWVAFTKVTGLSTLFPKSRLFGRYNLTYLDSEKTTEVEAISGSFMVIRNDAIKQAGLLDEDFFIYGEDLDWCYRFYHCGWKIIYLPETQIIHYKGRSTEKLSNSLKLFYGAMYLFVRKHFKKGWSSIPRWFLTVGIWFRESISFTIQLITRLLVPAIDLIFIQISLILALLIRFFHLEYWDAYLTVNIVYSSIWLTSLYGLGLYEKKVYSSSKAIGGVFLGLILNTSITFFFPQYAYSRKVVLLAGGFNSLFLSGWRLCIRIISNTRHFPFIGTIGKTFSRRRTLIIGTEHTSRQILKRIQQRIDSKYVVVGFLGIEEKEMLRKIDDKIPVLGLLEDLKQVASEHKIQEVIFSPEAASYERIVEIIAQAKNLHLDFKMVPRNLDTIIGRMSIDSLEDIVLVDLDYNIFSEPYRLIKRIMDILVSILLSPLWLSLWIVFIISPQWSFKRIDIIDESGKPISILEVRKNDEKVNYWCSTVPLFWEILIGRMSLVGTEIIHWEPSLIGLGFKPGITGLVQINQDKNLNRLEKEKYNVYYLRNYSLLLDIEIIIRTIFH